MSRDVVPIVEQPVRLRVNGLVVATLTCSPIALEPLAAGYLLATGFLREASHILAMRALPPADGVLGIDVEVPAALAAAGIREREHRSEHGCGPRFLIDCEPDVLHQRPLRAPDVGAFPGLFRELYERAVSYKTTGGLHTAGLSDGRALLHLHEEVGRHNAVDKAIGDALLDGRDLTTLGLVTTARISGEIAATAARAGLPWIASRSVPTTLAVEIAEAAGMAIVARAPGRDARLFAARA